MDPEIFRMLIPIVAITFGCTIPIVAIWSKHKEKVAKMQIDATAEHTAEKAAQYASQVQRLEDRVQVLERIVTDRGYDVATQIEALRDVRSVQGRETDAANAGIDTGVPLDFGHKEKA